MICSIFNSLSLEEVAHSRDANLKYYAKVKLFGRYANNRLKSRSTFSYKEMGRKTWKFICLLDAGRVILGDKRGFGKDSEFYDKLYQDLKKDWKRSPATDKSVAFAVGQVVT